MARFLLFLGEWVAISIFLGLINSALSERRWRQDTEHKERRELAGLCRKVQAEEDDATFRKGVNHGC